MLAVRRHPLGSLLIFLALIALVWSSESFIRRAALGTVEFLTLYNAYMIGLFVPEGAFVGLIWRKSLNRYVNPVSGRIISHGAGAILTVMIALLGFFLLAPAIRSFLWESYTAWATGPLPEVLLYLLWIPVSIIGLPVLTVALASPPGAGRVFKSMGRRLRW